jgi:hypothetical protein
MATLAKHIQDARRRLMWPTRTSLDDGPLSEYAIETIDELVTQMGNSHEPHFIQSGVISVDAGESVYSLDSIAPNYGKARYLYTEDDGSSDFQRRPVEIVSLEVLTERFRGGDRGAEIVGVPPSSSFPLIAQAAAVYYDVSRGNLIEFASVPQESIAYRFTWEPNVVRPQAKTDTGFHLDQFDNYVAALTARRALAHCQWKGLSRSEAKERRQEIREALDFDIGSVNERRGYAYLLWQYKLTTVNKTSITATGFGQDRW